MKPIKSVVGDNISICIASYNGQKWIGSQIDSILSQISYGDEVLVSDDQSDDETLSILKSYGARITIVNEDRVGGVVKNFEKVISSATKEIIVLSDQDDVWLPGRLDLIRSKLNDFDLIMMNADVVDEDLISKNLSVYEFVSFHKGFFKNFIRPKYVGCCMAFRSELLNIALPFPKNIEWHDWYISLIGELFYRCEIVSDKTILFRRHSTNNSKTGMKTDRKILKIMLSRMWMMHAIIVSIIRFFANKLSKEKS
jgi:glycosyltransferase involved in cell wall biosynthesis